MAISLDEKIDRGRVEQFATQIEHLPRNVRAWLEETFSGEHSVEFYEGLLSAYTVMYQVVRGMSKEKAEGYPGQIIAFVSNELKKKYRESTEQSSKESRA